MKEMIREAFKPVPREVKEEIKSKLGDDPGSVINDRWGLKGGETEDKYYGDEFSRKMQEEMDEYGLSAREEEEIILRLKALGYYPEVIRECFKVSINEQSRIGRQAKGASRFADPT